MNALDFQDSLIRHFRAIPPLVSYQKGDKRTDFWALHGNRDTAKLPGLPAWAGWIAFSLAQPVGIPRVRFYGIDTGRAVMLALAKLGFSPSTSI